MCYKLFIINLVITLLITNNIHGQTSYQPNSITYPDTANWTRKQVNEVTLLVPPKWNVKYNSFNGIELEIYPSHWYNIKSDLLTPTVMKSMGYKGTLEEFKKDELFQSQISFDLQETKTWLSSARSNIIWHIDTENCIYIEALDGGEKTFSCYGIKKVEDVNYWFDFDGLRYTGNGIVRLTQEDCLMAILVFRSIQKVQ